MKVICIDKNRPKARRVWEENSLSIKITGNRNPRLEIDGLHGFSGCGLTLWTSDIEQVSEEWIDEVCEASILKIYFNGDYASLNGITFNA